jgi:hypothetical protein
LRSRRVALVEALKIVLELGVSGFDELGQGRPREIAILVVDRLDPRAIHRQQLPAKQVQLAAEQYKFTEDLAKSIAVVAPKVSDCLEVCLISATHYVSDRRTASAARGIGAAVKPG